MARVVRTVLKHFKDSRGVSLYEITAAVAMTGILAAVAVPVVLDRVEDAKAARSGLETDTIAKALEAFKKDTGKYPGEVEELTLLVSTTDPLFLTSAVLPKLTAGGTALSCITTGSTGRNCADMNKYLSGTTAPAGYGNWRGPYMDEITKDQFGRAYTVNVKPLFTAEPGGANNYGYAWVFSAGADRTLDTPLTSQKLVDASDDLGKNLGKKVSSTQQQ